MQKLNIHGLDLNLLLVFEALLKDRNVTTAGARLHLSQPTMSHALKRLRAMCGDPLFVRTMQGMQPTAYALQLAAPIGQALDTVRSSLAGGWRFDPLTSTRTFNLVMTDIGQTVFLPRLLAHLGRAAPGVNLVVSQILRDQYRDALQSGAVDLALGRMPSLMTGFYQQRLFEYPYICLMRADHPRIGDELTFEQYIEEAHVQVALPGVMESVIDRALAQRDARRRIALNIPHYVAVRAILAETDLVATVPSLLAETSGPEDLKALPPPLPLPRVVVRQFWHERFHDDAGNRWLRGVIADLFLGNDER
jgi:DNA-binding transcriptional LysR family regulator